MTPPVTLNPYGLFDDDDSPYRDFRPRPQVEPKEVEPEEVEPEEVDLPAELKVELEEELDGEADRIEEAVLGGESPKGSPVRESAASSLGLDPAS